MATSPVPRLSKRFIVPIFLLLTITLNACSGVPTAVSTTLPPTSTKIVPTNTPAPTYTPSKSPSFAERLPTVTMTPTPVHSPTLTLTPKAPQFSLPSAPKTAIPTWRPPIYPVPWAPNPYDHFYLHRPVKASDIDYPRSEYGYGAVFFENVVHAGYDIPGDIGTPILAAGDGRVIWAGYGFYRGGSGHPDDPYGNAVVIKHDFGYKNQPLFTVYAHLSEVTIKKGQIVKAGDQVGLMGETGHTTGPHLHFEVRLGENNYYVTRNPGLWLSPPQGWGVLVGQVRNWDGRFLENRRINIIRYRDKDGQETDPYLFMPAETYNKQIVKQDPYYQENFVVPDLPAGRYIIKIFFLEEFNRVFSHTIEIHPGQVTYFTFQLWDGFTDGPPPTPEVQFTPAP